MGGCVEEWEMSDDDFGVGSVFRATVGACLVFLAGIIIWLSLCMVGSWLMVGSW